MVWPLNSSEGSATVSSASAEQVAIFAYFPGVTGSVSDDGYQGWIKLEEFQWGAGLGISRWRDDGADEEQEDEEVDENDFARKGECTDPSISEITITKCPGPESANLLFNMCGKKSYDKISIRFVRKAVGSSTYVPYMGYDTYNTLLSGFSVSAPRRYQEESKLPGESLSLNFVVLDFITFNKGVPTESMRYHTGTNTSTFRSGPNLEVAEVVKKQKEFKQRQEEIKSEEPTEETANDV
ncbi:hypothetical protein HWV62_522 [Athelia sp. TMB]|nr:hypothetical protein HWV62_522 [Athelia sp. TMB]